MTSARPPLLPPLPHGHHPFPSLPVALRLCFVTALFLVFCSQSPKVTAEELDRRIEAFLEDFRTVLADMSDADFDRNKASGGAVNTSSGERPFAAAWTASFSAFVFVC